MAALPIPSAYGASTSNGITLLEEILRHRGALASLFLDSGEPWILTACLAGLAGGLGAVYGITVGIPGGWRQALASAIKVPVVLLATLGICFPTLYVANVLLGANLSLPHMLALISGALAFHALLLASWAPICAFFSFGSAYHFLKLLHVGVFGTCGLLAMAGLLSGLRSEAPRIGMDPWQATIVFFAWSLIFGFVGTQMSWALRPLIGEPGLPFEWIRRRRPGLNFYTAVLLSLRTFKGERRPAQVGIIRPTHSTSSSES